MFSVFDGIEKVRLSNSEGHNYFEEGNYTVQIDSVFLKKKLMSNDTFFIVETTVKASGNNNCSGEQRNWVINLSNFSALKRIKYFLAACAGLSVKLNERQIDERITSAYCESAVAPSNPLKGKIVNLNCEKRISKNDKEYLEYQWEPASAI